MKFNLKQIATITTGSYFNSNPEANAYYLQSRDFDSYGNYIETLKTTIQVDARLKNQLEAGDILLVAKGNNFNAYLFQDLDKPAVASSVFLILRCSSNQIRPEYLLWYLNLESTQNQLKQLAKGTSIPSINKKTLEEIEIPLPDLVKQEKVIGYQQLAKQERQLYLQLLQRRTELNESILLKTIAKNENGK